MGNQTKNKCLRGLDDCTPLANISESEECASFVCVGYNKKEDRELEQDRFTLCWKNDVVDEHGHWDKRDLLDTQSVIAQALSTDENIRVNEEFSEQEMRKADFV